MRISTTCVQDNFIAALSIFLYVRDFQIVYLILSTYITSDISNIQSPVCIIAHNI
jgi:hypothetical protein